MDGFIIGIMILVVLVICIVSWFIRSQNRLVHTEELCGNAMSQIGVQQASRWDALNVLADLTKGYSLHEYQTLQETIATRKQINANTTAAEAQHQESILTRSFGLIHALAESYPDLKSNTVYLKTMDSVQDFEGKVRMSRMVYNDSVTKYNRLVRSFPSSIAAIMMGFRIREYLQEDSGKAAMPNMVR